MMIFSCKSPCNNVKDLFGKILVYPTKLKYPQESRDEIR